MCMGVCVDGAGIIKHDAEPSIAHVFLGPSLQVRMERTQGGEE